MTFASTVDKPQQESKESSTATAEKPAAPPVSYTVKRRWSCDDSTLNNLDPYLFELFDMLSIRRRHNTETEKLFCEAYMKGIQKADGKFVKFNTLKDPKTGDVLAYYYTASKERVLWSSHVDSVHNGAGHVKLAFDPFMMATYVEDSACPLGADDAAGMWLLFQMIRAGIGGTYIFHKAEEVGGVGSRGVAKHHQGFLSNFDYAIAFDRKATHSIFTHQGGSRCCSDAFGTSLSAILNNYVGIDYRLDDGGVFTDTKNYIDYIAEFTNLSCGYLHEHTSAETLAVQFLIDLKNALTKAFIGGFSGLKMQRKAGDKEPNKWMQKPPYSHNNAVARNTSSTTDWSKEYGKTLHKQKSNRGLPSWYSNNPLDIEDDDLLYAEREPYYQKYGKQTKKETELTPPDFLDRLLDKEALETVYFNMHDISAIELEMQESEIMDDPKYIEYDEEIIEQIVKLGRMSKDQLRSFIARTDLSKMVSVVKKLISEAGY